MLRPPPLTPSFVLIIPSASPPSLENRPFPLLFSLCAQLTLSSEAAFGVDAVFIDGVDVVFRGLEGPQLGAQVTVAVLAAVGTSGA